jgi:endoglucanase
MVSCRFRIFYLSIIIIPLHLGSAQLSGNIRLNQIGFYPSMQKIAIVLDTGNIPFFVISTSSSDTVFSGILTSVQTWSYSEESVSKADFSSFQTIGEYIIAVPGAGTSYPFKINERVHVDLAIGALKGFYYQRASTAILSSYGSKWARAIIGHPDTNVLIHSSAATVLRPAGYVISSSKGWYDAGDYNKYIVNSGISTYTILSTYEYFPEFCNRLTTNIPESGNGVPDIINEALWNIRWMLSMQDPNDGGVYAKCTDPNFDAYEMPWRDTQTRYVVKKTTAATLDFAAVMAQTARITKNFPSALPGFSDSCLQASLAAWQWARSNPSIYYYNNVQGISTGTYGDGNVSDEFAWAAAELFVTTAQDSFLNAANPLNSPGAYIPSWPNVRTLGLYTFANHLKTINVDTNDVRTRLIDLANSFRTSMDSSAYGVVMGVNTGDFNWGSNSVAANQGMELLIAFRLTGDSTYLRAALSNLDYLLGRNGTTYCFVTGFGSHSPRNIHHRISIADGVSDPVPGLLAGGPNPGRNDGVTTYPSSLPAIAYTDNFESYASNEICINWNAPLVYLAVGIEASLSPNGLPTSIEQDQNFRSISNNFNLLQNYPNPFNPTTTIAFHLPIKSYTSLKIFDIVGREAATLVSKELSAGDHSIQWNTGHLSSGVYFYRLQSGSFAETKKLVLLK